MARIRLLLRTSHVKILAGISLLLVLYYVFYARSYPSKLRQASLVLIFSRIIHIPSVTVDRDVKSLRLKILELSKTYVHELAERSMRIEDGPAAYPDTSYGMVP